MRIWERGSYRSGNENDDELRLDVEDLIRNEEVISDGASSRSVPSVEVGRSDPSTFHNRSLNSSAERRPHFENALRKVLPDLSIDNDEDLFFS